MQQNFNLRASPHNHLGASADPQRVIKIEETSAYHRSKHRAEVGSASKAANSLSQTKTHELLAKAIGAHSICSRDPFQDYQFDVHHLSTGNFDLIDIQWQGAFQLDQDPLDARYIIYLVLAGSLTQQIDQHQLVCCSPDTATTIGPGQTLASVASSEGRALLISIDRDSIDAALGKLLAGGAALKGNRGLKQPIIFFPSVDLDHELGRSLKKFGQFLWEAAANNNSADFSSLVLQKLEQAFLDCLIEGLPSNYSEEFLYQHDGALASHFRKARAFIESHLHEDIRLGDIAAATRVCSRLLQKAFSHHCGCSPMRFVTRSRLEQIQQQLAHAPSNTKIVDVMMDYGFTQGGKFAKEYQQLFGEKPSDTLKRSSQCQQADSPLWQQLDDDRSERVTGGQSITSSQSLFLSECLPSSSFGIWLHSIYFQQGIQTSIEKVDVSELCQIRSYSPLMCSRSAFTPSVLA